MESNQSNQLALGTHRITVTEAEIEYLFRLISADAEICTNGIVKGKILKKLKLLQLKIDAGIKTPDYVASGVERPRALKSMSAEEKFAAFSDGGDEESFMAEMAALSLQIAEEKQKVVGVSGSDSASSGNVTSIILVDGTELSK